MDRSIKLNNTHTRKPKIKKCNECNQRTKNLLDGNQICRQCYETKALFTPSGNKAIDDFIRYTLINRNTRDRSMIMVFVPYYRFKEIEFIAEGGFSKIYKATWIDGPVSSWDTKKQKYRHSRKMVVALKALSNSKNINSKDLNEVQYLILIFFITNLNILI